MTTQHIAYHNKTTDLALLHSEPYSYWIGSFDRFCTSQTELPYVWIAGNFATEAEGRAYLEKMTGDEF